MNIINDNTFNLYNSPLHNDSRYMKVLRTPNDGSVQQAVMIFT